MSKRLKYIIYMVSVIILILAVFNTYLTFRIHHKLVQAVSKPGRWPAGAYIYDKMIGFDFAPNISGPINDQSFYVKSHQYGYRISEQEDAVASRPGGILSLGCSFTYGDEVEAGQAYTQVAADSLGIPAYNYGICSFSYTHALLKAQKLKEQGILDQLKPAYVVLGCWNGLPDRSRTPFPPLASRSLAMPSAYLAKDGNGTEIIYPPKTQSAFVLIELYRKEGTRLNFTKFAKIFAAAPRYIILFMKNNRLAKEMRSRTFKSDVTEYEVYDFYFSAIEKVFSGYGSKILVLFMPNKPDEQPGSALKKALAGHPGIMLVNGLQAVKKYDVQVADYKENHPRPSAHMAYGREIVNVIRAGE